MNRFTKYNQFYKIKTFYSYLVLIGAMFCSSASVVKFKPKDFGNKLAEQTKNFPLQQISNLTNKQKNCISPQIQIISSKSTHRMYKTQLRENKTQQTHNQNKYSVYLPSREQILLNKIKERRNHIYHKNHQSGIQHNSDISGLEQKICFKENNNRKKCNIDLISENHQKSIVINKGLQDFLNRCKSFSYNNKTKLNENESSSFTQQNSNQYKSRDIKNYKTQFNKVKYSQSKISEYIKKIEQLQIKERILTSELRLSAFKNVQYFQQISELQKQNENFNLIILAMQGQKRTQKMTDSYCYSEQSDQSRGTILKSNTLLRQLDNASSFQNIHNLKSLQSSQYKDYKRFSSQISTLTEGDFFQKLCKIPTQSSSRSSIDHIMISLIEQKQKNQKTQKRLQNCQQNLEQLQQQLEEKNQKSQFYQQQIMNLKDCIDKTKVNNKSLLMQIRNLNAQKKQIQDRFNALQEQFFQYKSKIQCKDQPKKSNKMIQLSLPVIPSQTEIQQSCDSNQIAANSAQWFKIVCNVFDINHQQNCSKQLLMKKVITYQNKLIKITQKVCNLQQKLSDNQQQLQFLRTTNRKCTKQNIAFSSHQLMDIKSNNLSIPFFNIPIKKANSFDGIIIDNSY